MTSSRITILSLPAEIQLIILCRHFERVQIFVKYPYLVHRTVPYRQMRLRYGLGPLLVSKAFYKVASTAMYQSAMFYHDGNDDFHFGGARRSLRVWNRTWPEAFRKFRIIQGEISFARQFNNTCNDSFWPYEYLREIYIGELATKREDEGSMLRSIKEMQQKCRTRGVKVTAGLKKYFYTSNPKFAEGAHIDIYVRASGRIDLNRVFFVNREDFNDFKRKVDSIFGTKLGTPATADEDGYLYYRHYSHEYGTLPPGELETETTEKEAANMIS